MHAITTIGSASSWASGRWPVTRMSSYGKSTSETPAQIAGPTPSRSQRTSRYIDEPLRVRPDRATTLYAATGEESFAATQAGPTLVRSVALTEPGNVRPNGA